MILPIPVPASPLPLLSVPLAVEEGHGSTLPVVVSTTVNRPDFAWTAPLGCMVQVFAVAVARAVLTPRPATMTAAQPAARMRAQHRLLIAVSLASRTRPPAIMTSLVPARERVSGAGHGQPGQGCRGLTGW